MDLYDQAQKNNEPQSSDLPDLSSLMSPPQDSQPDQTQPPPPQIEPISALDVPVTPPISDQPTVNTDPVQPTQPEVSPLPTSTPPVASPETPMPTPQEVKPTDLASETVISSSPDANTLPTPDSSKPDTVANTPDTQTFMHMSDIPRDTVPSSPVTETVPSPAPLDNSPPNTTPPVPPNAATPSKKFTMGRGILFAVLALAILTLPVIGFFVNQRNTQIADTRSEASSRCCAGGTCRDGRSFDDDPTGAKTYPSCFARAEAICGAGNVTPGTGGEIQCPGGGGGQPTQPPSNNVCQPGSASGCEGQPFGGQISVQPGNICMICVRQAENKCGRQFCDSNANNCQGSCSVTRCNDLLPPLNGGNGICPNTSSGQAQFCCGGPINISVTPPRVSPTGTPSITNTPRPNNPNPTSTASCSIAGNPCSDSNKCCNGLVCQGQAGSKVCQQPATTPDQWCGGTPGSCGRLIAFHCNSDFPSGTPESGCFDNPIYIQNNDAAGWAQARAHVAGCGQIDVVCKSGPKENQLCGDFEIFKDNCGPGSQPTPIPISQCRNLKIYRDGIVVKTKDYNTLRPQQQIQFAVVSNQEAARARFYINGKDPVISTEKNENGEFFINWEIPEVGSQRTFTVQAEVRINGVWQ